MNKVGVQAGLRISWSPQQQLTKSTKCQSDPHKNDSVRIHINRLNVVVINIEQKGQ